MAGHVEHTQFKLRGNSCHCRIWKGYGIAYAANALISEKYFKMSSLFMLCFVDAAGVFVWRSCRVFF